MLTEQHALNELEQLKVRLDTECQILADCRAKATDRLRHTVPNTFQEGRYTGMREAYAHARDLITRVLTDMERHEAAMAAREARVSA